MPVAGYYTKKHTTERVPHWRRSFFLRVLPLLRLEQDGCEFVRRFPMLATHKARDLPTIASRGNVIPARRECGNDAMSPLKAGKVLVHQVVACFPIRVSEEPRSNVTRTASDVIL